MFSIKFLIFCAPLCMVLCQDVLPPDPSDLIPTTTTVPEDTSSPATVLDCPTGCTCEAFNPKEHCCPMGYAYNRMWQSCLPTYSRYNHFRYRRDIKKVKKYGMCIDGYQYTNGECVKFANNTVIKCSYPQKEIECCNINLPETCKADRWGKQCSKEAYYYCGDLCEKGNTLTEEELKKEISKQLKQFQSNWNRFWPVEMDPFSTCCTPYRK